MKEKPATSEMKPLFEVGERRGTPSVSAFPLGALIPISLSVLCITGSFLVIFLSDHGNVDVWGPLKLSVPPAVLLSLFSTTFRTCQFTLLAYVTPIIWWRSASKGTSLKNLHQVWNAGTSASLMGAVKAAFSGKIPGAILLAIYAIEILSMVEAPMMQSSSESVIWDHTTTYQSTYALPNAITGGWTGSVDSTAPARLFATPTFQSILQEWHLNKTIPAGECHGTCMGEVQGAGIPIQCSSSTQYVDLGVLDGSNTTAFGIKFERHSDEAGDPELNMELSYFAKVNDRCNATKEIQRCSIHTALVAYPIIYDNNSTFLNTSEMPRIISLQPSLSDAVDAHDNQPAGALAGLHFLAYYYLNSSVIVFQNASQYWSEPSYGILGQQYADYDPTHFDNNNACAFQWTNATDHVVNSLHNAMFRMALATSNGNEAAEASTWTQRSLTLVYESDYYKFAIAMAAIIISLLCSLYLFWRFWELQRQVSLSPLETARALAHAILPLQHGKPDMDIDELIRLVGNTEVKWERRTRTADGATDD